MVQVFSKAADTWLRVGVTACALVFIASVALAAGLIKSDYLTGRGEAPHQVVPFSHEHHVGDIGLDCRFCHTSVETSATAGLPPTETCMTCHSQLFTDAALLQPVRDSWRTRTPLHWTSVNHLPDFVYFDHSVHIAAGVGCTECHGQIDHMALTRKAETLTMDFCIGCHRDPAAHLRPRAQVFNMSWQPLADALRHGEKLLTAHGIETARLTDCYACHR